MTIEERANVAYRGTLDVVMGELLSVANDTREQIAKEVETMYQRIDGAGWLMQDGKILIAKEIAAKIRGNK